MALAFLSAERSKDPNKQVGAPGWLWGGPGCQEHDSPGGHASVPAGIYATACLKGVHGVCMALWLGTWLLWSSRHIRCDRGIRQAKAAPRLT